MFIICGFAGFLTSGFGFTSGFTSGFGAGAGFGAGFGMRSGSHSATARAGVHWLVRTHTPAPIARTMPPCVSVRYPSFLSPVAADPVAGISAAHVATVAKVIRNTELIFLFLLIYDELRSR